MAITEDIPAATAQDTHASWRDPLGQGQGEGNWGQLCSFITNIPRLSQKFSRVCSGASTADANGLGCRDMGNNKGPLYIMTQIRHLFSSL